MVLSDPVVIAMTSTIDADADKVWRRIVSPEGINDEMLPWMTMSIPRGAETMTIDAVPVGQPLGRAWLKLFGIVPLDYDLLTIAELVPGQRFHEKSTMLSMRRWEHERSLAKVSDGRTAIHDRITFEPRAPLRPMAPLIARMLSNFFRHRHRRLQQHFSSASLDRS